MLCPMSGIVGKMLGIAQVLNFQEQMNGANIQHCHSAFLTRPHAQQDTYETWFLTRLLPRYALKPAQDLSCIQRYYTVELLLMRG